MEPRSEERGKGAGAGSATFSIASLQWSRAPKSAERPYIHKSVIVVIPHRFNGAALRRARKAILAISYCQFPVVASMEPRSEERGKFERLFLSLVSQCGFNGAALRRARKVTRR